MAWLEPAKDEVNYTFELLPEVLKDDVVLVLPARTLTIVSLIEFILTTVFFVPLSL